MTSSPIAFCVFIATSVDGFIARPDGAIDWLNVVEMPGEDYGYAAFAASIDTIIMGRGTYDTVRTFPSWPYAGKRVIVWTHRAIEPIADEASFSDNLDALVAHVQTLGSRRIYVDGGNVIRQFLAAGHVAELTVSTIPVLLGRGIPLFDGNGNEHRLQHGSTRSWPSGLVQTVWHMAAPMSPTRDL